MSQKNQPIEEELRAELVEMIQDCQARVFSSYQSRLTTTNGNTTSPIAPPNFERSTSQQSLKNEHAPSTYNQPAKDRDNEETANMLEGFFQEPPPQDRELQLFSLPAENTFYLYPAYISDLPTIPSIQTSSQEHSDGNVASQVSSSRTPPSVDINAFDAKIRDNDSNFFAVDDGKSLEMQDMGLYFNSFTPNGEVEGQLQCNVDLDNFDWELGGQEQSLQLWPWS